MMNNYAELKGYVKDFQTSLSKQNMEIKTGPWTNNNVAVGFFINGQQVAVNVVAPGGGNVIAAGGGNILINTNMAGVNFGGRYVTQSEGSRVIPTSGKGPLIIK
jgi:uncharacterized protein YigE (DUF2233 family)